MVVACLVFISAGLLLVSGVLLLGCLGAVQQRDLLRKQLADLALLTCAVRARVSVLPARLGPLLSDLICEVQAAREGYGLGEGAQVAVDGDKLVQVLTDMQLALNAQRRDVEEAYTEYKKHAARNSTIVALMGTRLAAELDASLKEKRC